MTSISSKRHAFSFEGGDKLTSIGATFFVSYLYYKYVDPTHNNWALVKTKRQRISTINSSQNYHRVWLEHIADMSETNLNRNTIGLKGSTIKEMALAIKQLTAIGTINHPIVLER